MTNQILTISQITKETLRILKNSLVFTSGVNRDYDDRFAVSGAKIGDTINIRKPARFVGRTGQALSIENHIEGSVPLQLNTQFGVDVVFTSKDLTLSLDMFAERFLKPAVATVANKVDFDGLTLAKNTTFNAVGTPGTVANALLTYLNAGVKLNNEGAPKDEDRSIILDAQAEATLVDAQKGYFNSQPDIAKQYRSGRMGFAAGFDWAMSQNIIKHTNGALGGTPLVNGASQTGSSLITDGWTSAVANRLKQGDIFTIDGVYGVNPQNRQSTGVLKQFVVTADTSSDVSGNLTIPIYPPINPPGVSATLTQFQTVDSVPANNAAITVMGSASVISTENIAYHRNAFTLGTADLEMPKGVDMAARVSDPDSGLSIRMVRAYDINNDRMPCRLDILYGWAAIYPELACRIRG